MSSPYEGNCSDLYVVYREGDLHPIDLVTSSWKAAMFLTAKRVDRIMETWRDGEKISDADYEEVLETLKLFNMKNLLE